MARAKDLTGRRFGRLLAEYPTDRRDHRGSVYWHCRCDCGNELDVSESSLMHGRYQSCGCLRKELGRELPDQLTRIDGTCIEFLENRKHRRDNTSGFRGVFQRKDQKYRAMIGFKGKRYYLGIYDQYEDAVRARLEAEELIYGGFVDAYRRWKERADADPEWGEGHPLVFEVEKKNGRLTIRTG